MKFGMFVPQGWRHDLVDIDPIRIVQFRDRLAQIPDARFHVMSTAHNGTGRRGRIRKEEAHPVIVRNGHIAHFRECSAQVCHIATGATNKGATEGNKDHGSCLQHIPGGHVHVHLQGLGTACHSRVASEGDPKDLCNRCKLFGLISAFTTALAMY